VTGTTTGTKRPTVGKTARRRGVQLLFAVCGLLLLVDLLDLLGLGYHKHPHFPFEGWLGFYGLFAFFGSVALVLVAVTLRRLLKRDADYYHDGHEEDHDDFSDGDEGVAGG
jgi:hypothetical protein